MDRHRELVAALRSELAAVDPARRCCRQAERAGLGRAATGRARSIVVARLAVRLEAASEGDPSPMAWDWERAPDHCRMAWLRGRFLATGSLSLAHGRTHLEFVVDKEDAAPLAARTAALGLPASWRLRRGRGVVTWKDRELVLGFLRRAGATAAALESEARGVGASLAGYLNRVVNAEGANLARSAASSARQGRAVHALNERDLERLPEFTRTLARIRLETPESTFTEMATRTGASRARVQRAIRRLEAVAEQVALARGPR